MDVKSTGTVGDEHEVPRVRLGTGIKFNFNAFNLSL
jgi:hypothetical protein